MKRFRCSWKGRDEMIVASAFNPSPADALACLIQRRASDLVAGDYSISATPTGGMMIDFPVLVEGYVLAHEAKQASVEFVYSANIPTLTNRHEITVEELVDLELEAEEVA